MLGDAGGARSTREGKKNVPVEEGVKSHRVSRWGRGLSFRILAPRAP